MADTSESTAREQDRVFTYMVSYSTSRITPREGFVSVTTPDSEYDRLQKSLAEGWRVADIIAVPFGSAGGGGTSEGGAAITVLLHKDHTISRAYHKKS
jgi:hypothetical protein